MRASTHQTFGITFGLVAVLMMQVFQYYEILPSKVSEYVLYLVIVLFGSLLPDLDHPKSKLGRMVPFLSYPMYWFFGHRTFTHSLTFVVLAAVLGMAITYAFNFSIFLGLALAVGVLSHVVGDFLTSSGVPLFFPFLKRRFKSPFTFSTGSFFEFIFNSFLFIVNGLLIYFYFLKGVINV